MSAPSSPGLFNKVSASKSVAIITSPFCLWIFSICLEKSIIDPSLPGYCNKAPKYVSLSVSESSIGSPIVTSIPIGFALAVTTEIV